MNDSFYERKRIKRAGSYSKLISLTNLFDAWQEFRKGKSKKRDVQLFERHLEDNIFKLHQILKKKTYKHGGYFDFYVNDPKRRHIHKASVQDRVIHHLLYKYLYAIFDKTFIYDSYSCRLKKGTHRAVIRLNTLSKRVSNNYSGTCWVLKCDIKKFFASVDHDILINLLSKQVKEKDMLQFLKEIIESFHSEYGNDVGIPLGNLTSQIFSNVYLNELDRFIKYRLRIKYYLRYADDFIILSESKEFLPKHLFEIKNFLSTELKLELHPNKVTIRNLKWGIDFCGYIVLPNYILTRTKTRRRIIRKVSKGRISDQSLQSYLGYFSHANSFLIEQNLKNLFFFKISSTQLT